MTADRLAEAARPPEHEAPDRERRGLSATTVLGICDRLLGEVGRRHHIFAWLRAPGSAADEWLPVDAYYPRARLVVMCRPSPDPHDALYRELVPAHGLGLLRLDTDVLGEDEAAVETALAGKIFDLERIPRPANRPSSGSPATVPPIAAPTAGPDVPPPAWTPVTVQRAAVAPAFEQGAGVLFGLGLAAVLIVEVYLGVVDLAFGAGRVMLGFAIALEACSRAIGTVAAVRAGERAWAGACAIVGAPLVIWFAFLRPPARTAADPAPLAGLLAGVAALVAVLALILGL